MNKTFTRLLSLLLALVLCAGLMPTTASAATNITGTWETDFTFSAAELGVEASDSVLRCTLNFQTDGTVSAAWAPVDMTALRLYFHQMFVSAYYAMAYGMGMTDIHEIEATCQESTGMTVSAYMDTIVTPAAIEAAFTPANDFGTYAVIGSDLYLTLTLLGTPSDSAIPNSMVRGGGTLYIQAASFGRSDYTLICHGTDISSEETVANDYGMIVDLTEKLDTLMQVNAAALEQFLAEKGYVLAALFYHAMVTDGGDWDIKLQDEWRFEPGKTYVYRGKVLRMDDPGNIHFGYTGAILFPEEFVCFGAGMNNLLKFGFDQGDLESYYDDPQDQEMMRWGYQMYKEQHGQ